MEHFDFFHFIQVFKFKNKMQNSPRTPKTPNTRKELTLEKKEVLNRITKGALYRKIQELFIWTN